MKILLNMSTDSVESPEVTRFAIPVQTRARRPKQLEHTFEDTSPLSTHSGIGIVYGAHRVQTTYPQVRQWNFLFGW
jgi:hypothetical protein